MLKIQGRLKNDKLADMLTPKFEVSEYSDLDALCDFNVRSAILDYHSKYHPECPGKPFLILLGKCDKLKFNIEQGDTELSFNNDSVLNMRLYYEFSADELKRMIDIGLFDKDFSCPDILFNNVLEEIPVKVDLKVIEPDASGKLQFPLVYADIKNKLLLNTNAADCGYTLGEYFERHEPTAEEIKEKEKNEVLELHSWEADSLFEASDDKVKETPGKVKDLESEDLIERDSNYMTAREKARQMENETFFPVSEPEVADEHHIEVKPIESPEPEVKAFRRDLEIAESHDDKLIDVEQRKSKLEQLSDEQKRELELERKQNALADADKRSQKYAQQHFGDSSDLSTLDNKSDDKSVDGDELDEVLDFS